MTPEWEDFERKLAALSCAVAAVRDKLHAPTASEIDHLLELVRRSDTQMFDIRVALENEKTGRKETK